MLVTILAFIITLMFFLSGVDKALKFDHVSEGLKKRTDWSKESSDAALLLATALELFAPPVIVIGTFVKKIGFFAFLACVGLAVFTVIATLVYHWPPEKHWYAFTSNITTTGALLLLSRQFTL